MPIHGGDYYNIHTPNNYWINK